ncbi:MAG: adenylate/guanylate cyclase domain-containing protein [Chloroflexi bacterium]|nr:adenylate/guanylate cyclase domain-containing protein [Chloroflexota bacterium]
MNGYSSLLARADRFFSNRLTHLPPPFNDARLRLRLQAGAAIALGVCFFVYLLLFSNLLAPFNRFATDFLYHPISPHPDIAIIAIDSKSLDELGPWPWSRAIHAALLDRLENIPPRLVAFDLLFAQPTPDDSSFAATLQANHNVLVATSGVAAAAYPNEADALRAFDVVILPDATLRDAFSGIGHRTIIPDSDGVVRHIPSAIQSAGVTYPALGLAAAAHALGIQEIQYDLAARVVRAGIVQIPVDEHGNALLNFTSPSSGIPTYSYVDVFRGSVPASALQDKIVFIGGTGSIETEEYAIPLNFGEARTHNVNLQADLASMLLNSPPNTLQTQEALGQLALTLAFALLAGLTLPHLRPLYSIAITLVYLLGLLLYAFEAFNRGTVIQILYPALALILTALSITAFRYLFEERRRHFLASLFRRYVPAESVGRVVDAIDRGELPLSGARRIVTVLYADLRGFTTLSEELSAETVLATVNRYMELALQAIQAEGGTISKPMGDALIAIWNAPLDQPDHCERGLRTAIQIRRNLMRYQQKRSAEEKLNFGIGLATGWAVLGNVSALGKVEYTLVGDTVNVAARISAFANNNQILTDATTARQAPEGIVLRELSPVRVRGRKEPLAVWEARDQEPLEEVMNPDEPEV